MSDGIRVDAEQLRTHASHVDDDAYELSRAWNAAMTVSVDGQAFGKLIGFVGSWFMEQEAELAESYLATVTALHEDASNVRDTAGDYDRTDAAAADRATQAAPTIELPL
jgi:excreted virulence factor EspC (type VII ESX diderm)